ncbi:hypothetical protein [Amycolatopsis granulosa]|uniref:hypothetical protein n=1 Tax=Amycolatopsis granulosa TaxID=185684 RepID=UPI0014207201|nr:hypothetical protein [Amycolatopsis granulosa]NIH87691.1 hypothetical protein [Amycolatopsis granulosa]
MAADDLGALSDADLDAIEERVSAATPGPWYFHLLDDDWSMSLVAVSTVPDSEHTGGRAEFDPGTVVAGTLVQHPRYVDVADQRWDENAQFIAAARTDVPRLLAEVRRLRRLLDGQSA